MRKLFLFLFIPVVFFSCKKDNSNDSAHSNTDLADSFSNLQAGAVAKSLLDSSYTTLSIEIQYMPGYQPSDAVVNNMRSFLAAYCNKPAGINIMLKLMPTQNKDTMSLTEVMQFEQKNRLHYTNGKNIWLYMLVTDGYNSDSTLSGAAYRSTSLCVFGRNVFANSGAYLQPNRDILYSTVVEHELGHLLGLVNSGTPMVVSHEDATHAHNCNNYKCLMYFTSETTGVAGVPVTGSVPMLDSNCINDLRGNGSR